MPRDYELLLLVVVRSIVCSTYLSRDVVIFVPQLARHHEYHVVLP